MPAYEIIAIITCGVMTGLCMHDYDSAVSIVEKDGASTRATVWLAALVIVVVVWAASA